MVKHCLNDSYSRVSIFTRGSFILLLGIVTIAFLFIGGLRPDWPAVLLVGMVFAIACEAVYFGYNFTNPVNLLCLFYFATFYYPLYFSGLPSRIGEQANLVIYFGFISIMAGGVVGVLFSGFTLTHSGAAAVGGAADIKIKPLLLIGWFCICVVLASWIATPELITAPRGMYQFEGGSGLTRAANLVSIFLPGVSLLAFVKLIHCRFSFNNVSRNRVAQFLCLMVLLFPFLYDMLTGGRAHIVITAIAWLIAYTVFVGALGAWKTVLVSIALPLVGAIAMAFRSAKALEIDVAQFLSENDLVNVASIMNLALAMGPQPDIVNDIIGYAQLHGFQYGLSHLKAIANIIPLNLFYDDKFPLSLFYKKEFFPNENMGRDFTNIAEFYLQGGAPWVMIALFLESFLLVVLYAALARGRRLSFLFAYVGCIVGAVWWFRADTLNFIRYVEGFVGVFIAYRLLVMKLLGPGQAIGGDTVSGSRS